LHFLGYLFEEILQEKYDDLWLKYCGDNAEQVAMLKEYISGNLYGEDAFKAYGDGSNGFGASLYAGGLTCWELSRDHGFSF